MSNNEPWQQRPTQGPDPVAPRHGLGATWANHVGGPQGNGQPASDQHPPAPAQEPVPGCAQQSAPGRGGREGHTPRGQQASLGQRYPAATGRRGRPQPVVADSSTRAGRRAHLDPLRARTPSARTQVKAGLGRLMGWGAVASALLTVVGCFGTWMYVTFGGSFGDLHVSANGLGMTSSNVPERSSSGAEPFRDGWFVLIPALIAAALGTLRALGRLPKPAMWASLVMGLAVTGVSLFEWNDIRSKVGEVKQSMDALDSEATFSAGSGWGLGLCILAGVALLVTSAVSALRD